MQEILNVAIPFDMLFDTEMGLVNTIRIGFRTRMFLVEQAENEEFMKICLRDRASKNPLSVMMYDKSIADEEVDEMYFQFMDEEYRRIIALSPSTAIWKMVCISSKLVDKVRYTVVYANDIELEILDRYGFTGERYKGKITDPEIMNNNSVIYVKDITVLHSLKEVHRKHVYVADYYHNKIMVGDQLVPDIMEDFEEKYSSSEFMFVNMYEIDWSVLDEFRKKEEH